MTMRFPAKTLGLAVASVIFAFGCGKEAPPPPPPKAEAPAAPPPKPSVTVKIGHVAPLTGPQAHLGKDNENGARLAIEEANAKKMEIGGAMVTFDLLGEDDQADPKQGTTVAQKLIDAKVNGVIGHLNSGTTIPASKLYADAGIPQISPSATNPKYTQQGFKTAYRVMANDEQQGKVLGGYATQQLAAKNIAIVDDRTAYGQGVADEFEKAAVAGGAKIVAREFTNDKATDFAAILTKIKSKKPDLVMYGGMDAQAGPMAQQLKKLGIKAKMIFADGGCTTEFHKLAGDAAEGHYCSLPGVPLEKMPGGTAFKEKYAKRFNVDIQLYAPYSYDAANVMIDAMKRANSVEPAKVLAELPKTAFDGVTAKITFDEKGDVKDGAITLYQAKGGKWDPLETIGGAAPAQPAAMDGMAGMGGMAPMGGMSSMGGTAGMGGMSISPPPAAAAPVEKK
ncbi:branched-chain amino acid ABC transporter substrate-binding protein [Candidatus Desulfobacillus denitrificans]|uniref:Branched-chain amino acid ABC transporter substrate-binding protein n=1 Tax=Candidatus Desulfobacillus denitrificans TaxID=2608985 RepID=A0A809QVH0_9PROT|nr:branched-chain amino acid ABC transporter substrate-binding protein [Candidatus Desulfobacillus denitrificans]GIK45401.1 MAG: branched chain amino acid ABC transporter substrate-binding protein [Betaproteobacteria bacterium]